MLQGAQMTPQPELSNADKLREFVRKREEFAGKYRDCKSAFENRSTGVEFVPVENAYKKSFSEFQDDSMNSSQTYAAIVRELVQALEKADEALTLFNGFTRLSLIDDKDAERNVSRALELQDEVSDALTRAATLAERGRG